MRVVSSSNPLLLLGEFQQSHTTHSAAKAAEEGASKGRGESKCASTSKCACTSKGARPRKGCVLIMSLYDKCARLPKHCLALNPEVPKKAVSKAPELALKINWMHT
eukprot:1157502-Pelagomonas_calceolata.AAC.8